MVRCQEQVLEAHQRAPIHDNASVINECVTLVGPAGASYFTQAHENAVRQQAASARYPDLLFGPLVRNSSPVYSCVREASGLVVRVMRHDTLLPEQQRQLAEFRFHQYILWHWYDTRIIIAHQIQSDPAFLSLPPTTLHACIGTADGQILAYFAIQPAVDRGEPSLLHRVVPECAPHQYRLGQVERPLFPAEWESFGPAAFASLPALQQTPIDQIRELNCLLRNQAASFVRTAIAVVETAYTICRVLLLPELRLSALVGCGNQDARKVLTKLGMPMLYAPHAPVIQNHLPYYWSADMNDSGKFWPFAASAADFLANPEHLLYLDEILALGPPAISRALVQFHRGAHKIAPKTILPAMPTLPYFWSDDPFQLLPLLAKSARNVVSPEGNDNVLSLPRPTRRRWHLRLIPG